MVKLFDDFFAFMRYCLGYKRNISNVVAGMNWQMLYSFASKQALLGLCFDGIERLGEEYPKELKRNSIGRELLMTWMGVTQQIHRQNMKVNMVASNLFCNAQMLLACQMALETSLYQRQHSTLFIS